ncbi:hypothetical protein SAMN05421594_4218 [Chryseobacterium oleae]|uniref:Uncharacterized protein n=1 Tax=Chryseobacterium oleae TaxID=491207 RepID=A0A1I5BVM2_CHROL|nr:hypothetical protein [Chryseobacterium oleae]SFN78753.1 hypothetical protein SAMN05421594_4218 [Chryseobacterium oleae]
MKQLYIILMLLTCFITTDAQQKSFSDYEHQLDTALKNYSKSPNYQYLKDLVTYFKAAKKLNAKHLTKDVVGIAVFLDNGNSHLDLFPAVYTYDNDKVDISALRSSITKMPSDEMKEYADAFLNNRRDIGKSKIFQSLLTDHPKAESTYTELPNEYKVVSPADVSFVRGNDDWMYAISFGSEGIIIYAFKLSLADEEISGKKVVEKIRQEKEDELTTLLEKYPYAHYSDDHGIYSYIKRLRESTPFSKDKEFLKNTESYEQRIKRDSLINHIGMFNYLLKLKFPKELLEDGAENIDIYGLKHFSAHTLGDYYFFKQDYNKAIEYYRKAVFDFPNSSDSRVCRDVENSLLSISKSYRQLNKMNDAYASLLGAIYSCGNISDTEEKQFNNYIATDTADRDQLKKDIDQSLLTIKNLKNNYYSFTFRNKTSFFYGKDEFVKNITRHMTTTHFYQSLK